MTAWWSALTLVEQIFYGVAIVSSAVLVVQFILNLIGLSGHDAGGMEGVDLHVDMPHLDVGHLDMGYLDASHMDMTHMAVSHDAPIDQPGHDTGLRIISIRTVLAFLVGFGWAGVIFLRADFSVWLAVIFAFGVGFIFMLVVFWLMRSIYGLSEAGNVQIVNAVGHTGSVYLAIPANGVGNGQVQVVVQGRMRELAAVTDGPQLATGVRVKVVRMFNNDTVLVRRLEVDDDGSLSVQTS